MRMTEDELNGFIEQKTQDPHLQEIVDVSQTSNSVLIFNPKKYGVGEREMRKPNDRDFDWNLFRDRDTKKVLLEKIMKKFIGILKEYVQTGVEEKFVRKLSPDLTRTEIKDLYPSNLNSNGLKETAHVPILRICAGLIYPLVYDDATNDPQTLDRRQKLRDLASEYLQAIYGTSSLLKKTNTAEALPAVPRGGVFTRFTKKQ